MDEIVYGGLLPHTPTSMTGNASSFAVSVLVASLAVLVIEVHLSVVLADTEVGASQKADETCSAQVLAFEPTVRDAT